MDEREQAQLLMEEDRFAARCLALIGRIRRTGEAVVITRRGKPVARLVAIADAPDEDDAVVWDLEAIGP